MKFPATLLLALLLAGPTQAADTQTLLQLIDYVGVDYPEAVAGGAIINELEYAEMREFSTRISATITTLESPPPELAGLAGRLASSVEQKHEPAEIAALTADMRRLIMENYEVALTPARLPDLRRAQELYARNCASCHGDHGGGDGPAGAALDPPPTDFLDVERARQRSLYGLYNTITLGVNGTGMASFAALPEEDRWSLAFHVGGYAARGSETGRNAWLALSPTLQDAVTLSPAEIEQRMSGGEAAAFWMRHNPRALFRAGADPLDLAVHRLRQSQASLLAGDRATAEQYALSAYLDGVELSEAALINVAPQLMRELEVAMQSYRLAVSGDEDASAVAEKLAEAERLIAEAKSALSGDAMSGWGAFTSSLIILLREGLEAILVLAAMIAFLVRTGQQPALFYVHAGWVGALAAGAVTWALSAYVFTISGAAREVAEGAAALLAAAILFYVGWWMHRNSNMARWSRYLHGQMREALGRQQLWTLALISFLAVYREVFETILFYQALWLQVAQATHGAVFAGAAVAGVLLAAAVWIFSRTGMRLPLRQFFLASAMLMIILAVIFTGHGIGALQEAGRLPLHPLLLPGIEYIGLHPTVEALSLQLLVLAAAIGLALYDRRKRAG